MQKKPLETIYSESSDSDKYDLNKYDKMLPQKLID